MKKDVLAVPEAAPRADEVLGLARAGSEVARERLRALSPEQLAGAASALLPRQRAELLELLERPEEVVPLLPSAEFATTVVATGLEDAGWLVAHASPEQRVAGVDLDCWKDLRLSASRLFEWIDAMIEAGPETLVAAFDDLDPELWIVAMKEMADFRIGDDEENDELETHDGFVFYEPSSSYHEERIKAVLGTALLYSPIHYRDFVYGALSESQKACEAYAARSRRARLSELGFPEREEAMQVYRRLRTDAVELPLIVDEDELGTQSAEAATRPPALLDGTGVGQALAELPPERASEVFRDLLGVANALAVADELPLADPDSVASSLRKALRGVDLGLAELSRTRQRAPSALLDAVPPLDLFRVGAAADDKLRPRKSIADLEAEEAGDDWNVKTEILAPEDQILADDGKLRR